MSPCITVKICKSSLPKEFEDFYIQQSTLRLSAFAPSLKAVAVLRWFDSKAHLGLRQVDW